MTHILEENVIAIIKKKCPNTSSETIKLFNELRERIFKMDDSIIENGTSDYIGYKAEGSRLFTMIIPRVNNLVVFVLPSVSFHSRLKNSVEKRLKKKFELRTIKEIDDFGMHIIKQSYDTSVKNKEIYQLNNKDGLHNQTQVSETILIQDEILSPNENEQFFLKWLIESKRMNESTAKYYVACINYVSEVTLDNNFYKESLFRIILFGNKAFQHRNRQKHSMYGTALKWYAKFLKETEDSQENVARTMVSTEAEVLLKQDAEISSKMVCPDGEVYEGQFIDNEYISDIGNRTAIINSADCYINKRQYSHIEKFCLKVLNQHFPIGIKVSSSININKFKRFAEYLDTQIALPDDEMLRKIIPAITINYGDNLFMSPDRAIEDKDLLAQIIQFVIDAFNNGKNSVYYDGVYNSFKNQLIDTNIYNKDNLKGILDYYLDSSFSVKKSFIAIANDVEISVDEEIEEVIKNSEVPMGRDDILKLLPHISDKKVNEVLKLNANIIYWKKNTYWHIDKIEITEQEKYLLSDIIAFEIQNGFISIKRLLDVLQKQTTDFMENNCIINHVCLRDILKYHFADKFGFKYTFVGKIGEEMSGIVATQKFIEGKEMFTLTELSEFVEENDLPGMYSLFIEEASKTYIRIDEDNFILKEKLNINLNIEMIKAIEIATKKYLTNGYAPLGSIDSFTIFPAIGAQWNIFLLQSIIEGYCNNLSIYSPSRSVTKSIGVIADNSFGFDNYEEILIKEIATQDAKVYFEDEEAAIEYLFDNGYIAQRRIKNFDSLFAMAKLKNTQAINALDKE